MIKTNEIFALNLINDDNRDVGWKMMIEIISCFDDCKIQSLSDDELNEAADQFPKFLKLLVDNREIIRTIPNIQTFIKKNAEIFDKINAELVKRQEIINTMKRSSHEECDFILDKEDLLTEQIFGIAKVIIEYHEQYLKINSDLRSNAELVIVELIKSCVERISKINEWKMSYTKKYNMQIDNKNLTDFKSYGFIVLYMEGNKEKFNTEQINIMKSKFNNKDDIQAIIDTVMQSV